MAYKFQLGAAVLSGSVNVAEGAISGSAVSDTLAASIVSEIDDGEIPIAKLAEKTISGVDLGQNLNSLSKATNGGVNFTSYNGSAAVSNLQLDLADLAAASVAVGADSIAIIDADDDSSKKESIADLMTAVAGNGLAASSGVLAVGVDDSSIELNSDALRVKASGVTNAMLAGSIANAKLANDGITIGTTDTSLGGTITAIVGLTDLDLAAGNRTIFDSVGGNNLTIGASSTTVIIDGDLQVKGTTTSIDSTTINISSSFTFEGPADDFETSLSVGTPIQDIDIVMPEYSSSAGSHQVKMAVLASGGTAADYLAASLVTPAEFKILDGGTADSSVTVADGDKFIINDAGTMKQTAMSDLKDYIGTPSLTVSSGSNSATLAVGMNFFNNHGGAISATCPASAGLSNGDIIRIKAGPDCSATNSLTINRAGSQTFDATLTSIKLESPNAAVSLVYVDTDDFRIM
tara:strand:+ start:1302 stop:2687 length:1386 start_codon:yes stop_codon:yes gene_type:complete